MTLYGANSKAHGQKNGNATAGNQDSARGATRCQKSNTARTNCEIVNKSEAKIREFFEWFFAVELGVGGGILTLYREFFQKVFLKNSFKSERKIQIKK